LRRLFSTFAFGWPGVGLLLMRLVAGIGPALLDLVAIGDGALMVAGLWTPIAGSMLVILALWSTIAQNANPCPCIYLITFGVALVLLGPGGWSIDAHLFGWKRIDFRNR